MIKKFIYQWSRIKKYFNGQRFYKVQEKYDETPEKSTTKNIISYLKLTNPPVALLIESFQRYGYIKVSSSSKINSVELNDVIKNMKNKPLNCEDLPSYLSDCQSLNQMVDILEKIYSSDIGSEFFHLNSIEEYNWFTNKFSNRDEFYKIGDSERIEYLKLMNRAEQFDIFLGNKFQSVKRYSGEGIESALVAFLEIFKNASQQKISNIVISTCHRGRNNLLVTLLNYPPVLFFRKMLGLSEFPNQVKYPTGDTFSHFQYSMDFVNKDNPVVHISIIPNPSHLETSIPVGAGKIRSKMMSYLEGDYSKSQNSRNGDKVLGIFAHGDASVYGQGVVCESLVMTDSSNFSIGGGIHIVLNNQLGFTTETPNGVKNVTDIGKIINCPIIHVNAYNVISVAQAAMIAMDYRKTFRKDIFINIIGYRRWGHNELDDPTITQPVMYSKINASDSIVLEFKKLLNNTTDKNNIDEVSSDLEIWKRKLQEDLERAHDYEPQLLTFQQQWANQNILDVDLKSLGIYNTGFCIDKLKEIGKCSVYIPTNFKAHLNVYRTHIEKRLKKLSADELKNIDWATAEALAIGSLLAEGINCRISGQDVGRGTFSHRHFILIDQETNEQCIPFNVCPWPENLSKRGNLEVANSILSEEAVLGFEIGMAMDNPNNLIIWEAQFGDFFNGAQILIDTYLGSAETKWMLQNGLVVLLPHGYDGAGPEHSSCRLERFLQLTDSSETGCDGDFVNMHIINPTTPAQYFHALRRQIIRPFRRPLIVASPKLLLRSPLALSSLTDIEDNTYFHHVLPDEIQSDPESVKSVLLCSGKHYYAMKQYLQSSESINNKEFTIIRIEQLSPFPASELIEEITKFRNAQRFVWCQEEHRNMGAWQFVNPRFKNIMGIDLQYAGRKELATPAVGIGSLHKKEIENLWKATFSQ